MDKLDKWPVMNADKVIESLMERSKAAAMLGKLGGIASGKVKSEAKADASRENGKKGGRPKKRPA